MKLMRELPPPPSLPLSTATAQSFDGDPSAIRAFDADNDRSAGRAGDRDLADVDA